MHVICSNRLQLYSSYSQDEVVKKLQSKVSEIRLLACCEYCCLVGRHARKGGARKRCRDHYL